MSHEDKCDCDDCFMKREKAVLETTHLEDREDDRGCPCLLADTPCHKHCTCAQPGMSTGCRRCARYGSIEQRKGMAKNLAKILDRHYAYINALCGLDVEGIAKWVHLRLNNDRLNEVANALADIYVPVIGPDEVVAWLSATVSAKGQLGEARTQFVESARPEIVRAFGEDRVVKLWSRLG